VWVYRRGFRPLYEYDFGVILRAALSPPNPLLFAMIHGCTGWNSLARYTRSVYNEREDKTILRKHCSRVPIYRVDQPISRLWRNGGGWNVEAENLIFT